MKIIQYYRVPDFRFILPCKSLSNDQPTIVFNGDLTHDFYLDDFSGSWS